MLRTSEKETEILLGNKQLLGIFFVVAILLGVAFYGGYAVGKGAAPKVAPAGTVATPAPEQTTPAPNAGTGGETHSVPADSGSTTADTTAATTNTSATPIEEPLGSRNRNKKPARSQSQAAAEPMPSVTEPGQSSGSFTPSAGQTFLQVTAVGHDEAQAIADVLDRKGFRAHAVPKPGNSKLYRVLVGPIKDAGDLSATRDSLRKTGFREVIVQRY